jgi:Periplasmic binding protein-like domain
MQSLIRLSYKIPDDIRIVGIDDVGYASLLPTPLTTVHQPCREIGGAAVAVMLERLSTPGMPIRDILLDCRLVVRESCGAKKAGIRHSSRVTRRSQMDRILEPGTHKRLGSLDFQAGRSRHRRLASISCQPISPGIPKANSRMRRMSDRASAISPGMPSRFPSTM